MPGLHLTADLYQCRCEARWLGDAQQLGAWCLTAASTLGLPVRGHVYSGDANGTTGGGVSVALLLAGSHVCLHTRQKQRSASVDIYVDNVEADRAAAARQLMARIVERLQPEWTEQRSLDRGDEQ